MAKCTFLVVAVILVFQGGFTSTSAAAITKVYQQSSEGNSDIYSWSGVRLTDHADYDGQPSVSPDGGRIAFVSDRSGGNRLFIMNSDGSNLRQLNNHDSGYPAWSPQGDEIAYASLGRLRVAEVSSGQSRQLGNDRNVSHPSWSPDGAQLAYAAYVGFNSDIFTIGLNAGATEGGRRITVDPAYDQSPSWVPTGRIVFQSNRFGATDNLFLADPDGQNVAQLTHHVGSDRAAILPIAGSDGLVYFVGKTPTDGSSSEPRPQMLIPGGVQHQLLTARIEYLSVQTAKKPFDPSLRYAALGDSVAAGEGINESWRWSNGLWIGGSTAAVWEPDQLSPNGQNCHRSTRSYKYTVQAARGLSASSLVDYSCSGASVNNGLLAPQRFKDGSQATQSQVDAMFSDDPPDIVTLTVGANDIGFSDFLFKCYQPLAPRCDNLKNTMQQLLRLYQQQQDLARVIKQIVQLGRQRGKAPKIYLTGYFDPFLDSGPSCHDTRLVATASLTRSEAAWLKKGLELLNWSIKTVARGYAEVSYVDLSTTMKGHGFCSADPWVYGPSILLFELGSGAPYHPTPAGQDAIALRVIEAMA